MDVKIITKNIALVKLTNGRKIIERKKKDV